MKLEKFASAMKNLASINKSNLLTEASPVLQTLSITNPKHPAEILAGIFLWCIGNGTEFFGDTGYEAAFVIARVCSWWRSVALSHPLLWARIQMTFSEGTYNESRLKNGTSKLKLCLLRSSKLPLDFAVSFPPRQYDDVEYTPTESTSAMESTALSLVDRLSVFQERWRRADIDLSGVTEIPTPISLSGMKNLEEVCLTVPPRKTGITCTLVDFGDSPRLSTVVIAGYHSVTVGPAWFEHLRSVVSAPDAHPTKNELASMIGIQFFDVAPNLEEFAILSQNGRGWVLPGVKIPLFRVRPAGFLSVPSLMRLSLNTDDYTVTTLLLGALTCTNLTDLDLEMFTEMGGEEIANETLSTLFNDFINRSRPPLAYLRIVIPPPSFIFHDIEIRLQRLPTLQYLEIKGTISPRLLESLALRPVSESPGNVCPLLEEIFITAFGVNLSEWSSGATLQRIVDMVLSRWDELPSKRSLKKVSLILEDPEEMLKLRGLLDDESIAKCVEDGLELCFE